MVKLGEAYTELDGMKFVMNKQRYTAAKKEWIKWK
jgi:hypothetical protein